MELSLLISLIILIPLLVVGVTVLFINYRMRSYFSYNPSSIQENFKRGKAKRYQFLLGKIYAEPDYANKLNGYLIQELVEYLNYSMYDLLSSGRYNEKISLAMIDAQKVTKPTLLWLYRTGRNATIRQAVLKSNKLDESEKIVLVLKDNLN